MEYYRHGNVDLIAAVTVAVAVAVFVRGWCGTVIANHIAAPYLRLAFGMFVVALGFYLIFGALRGLA